MSLHSLLPEAFSRNSKDRFMLLTSWFVLVVFGLISFHAPLSVWLGTIWPQYDLAIKSWKEILMGIGFVAALPYMVKNGLATKLFRGELLLKLIVGFAGLQLIVLVLLYQGKAASSAGLLIDLRFFLFFSLVYGLVVWRPRLRPLIVKLCLATGLVVVGFGFLQVTVFPPDILTHIGYNASTIQPYLTVDKNPQFVRINSTLRGPNPLGLYMAGFISLVVSFLIVANKPCWLTKLLRWLKVRQAHRISWLEGGLIISLLAAIIVLWHSYSRSAVLAAIIGLLVVVSVRFRMVHRKFFFIGGSVGLLLVVGLLIVFHNSHFVQQVVFHINPGDDVAINSDDQHASSLNVAWQQVVTHPFGNGIGSTGSASLLGQRPNIVENQYLFVAHEAGWLGLLLFIMIFGMVLKRLYEKRGDYLSLGVFASGVGFAVAGLVLPVFADDTIAILWWGLAAVALGSNKKVT